MMWWNGGSGWGVGSGWIGWLVMGVLMLVFWGLLIFGGVALWRAAARADRGRKPVDKATITPEQVLDERFARGEIGLDEYTKRRELLHSQR